MSNVGFKVGGSNLSFGKFYRGFGLSCTVSMLFSATVCWQLGALAAARPREIAVIVWSLFVVQVIGVALSMKYFGWPPTLRRFGTSNVDDAFDLGKPPGHCVGRDVQDRRDFFDGQQVAHAFTPCSPHERLGVFASLSSIRTEARFA